ncbi:hypothetical protein ACFTZJ_22180 [Streptomyces globisporus]|uniref:hypothetical protein n=1 Tax=Streptomyces globisporus TaxID=1908 RepID=UPI00362E8AB6
MTRVLHMGPMAGPTLAHHNLMDRSVGFDMNLYAYTLPNGNPGRPFVRFADGDDTAADYFDTHKIETLRRFQDTLITALAGLADFTGKIQAWDRSASTTEQGWDEVARHDRPCQGRAGHGERCALCGPDAASPSQLLWLELLSSADAT